MTTIFGVPTQALFGQLLLGLINGSFYAILSLGLAIIFGLLNIINFAHGALYMMGAFGAWMLLNYLGIGYAARNSVAVRPRRGADAPPPARVTCVRGAAALTVTAASPTNVEHGFRRTLGMLQRCAKNSRA